MIAVTQSQAAYSTYVNGYKYIFTYFIKTIPDILYPPVECICYGGMEIKKCQGGVGMAMCLFKTDCAPLANLIVQQRIDKLPKDEEINSLSREFKN